MRLQASACMTLAHIIEEKDNHILKDAGKHTVTIILLAYNNVLIILTTCCPVQQLQCQLGRSLKFSFPHQYIGLKSFSEK